MKNRRPSVSRPSYVPLATLAVAVLVLTGTSGATRADELAPPRCDYGERHPAAPAEIEQFEFLIGDYTVRFHAWQGDTWSPPQPGTSARWNGWYGLGGMAIVDEWFNPDPGIDPDAPRGINVRMYDDKAQEWDMMWIATGANQVQDLRAQVKDGALTMWQVYPDRPDFKAIFEIEDDDHWARISFNKNDKGEWQKQFKLAATRIPCED
jgi:hypothetical protein